MIIIAVKNNGLILLLL